MALIKRNNDILRQSYREMSSLYVLAVAGITQSQLE